MRFVVAALAAVWIAYTADRRSHGRRPPQPRYDPHERRRAPYHSHQEASGDQPDWAAAPERGAEDRAAEHKRDESDERHKRGEFWYWWVTGSAAVLATAGTLAAAWFAYGAYTAGLRAVDEAQKQVAAARQANEISSRALSAALGASVHFGIPILRTSFGENRQIGFIIAVPITNDGGATARGLFVNLACTTGSTAAPATFDANALQRFRPQPYAVGTKDTINPNACFFNKRELERLAASRGNVAAFGRVWHRDSIEPALTHRSELCFVFSDIVIRDNVDTGVAALVRPCDTHNCSDEDCGADWQPPQSATTG